MVESAGLVAGLSREVVMGEGKGLVRQSDTENNEDRQRC